MQDGRQEPVKENKMKDKGQEKKKTGKGKKRVWGEEKSRKKKEVRVNKKN